MNKKLLMAALISLISLTSVAAPCYASWWWSWISGTVEPSRTDPHDKGYYDTYIYVYIGGVNATGKKLTVTISEDGDTIWSGLLGAGQSSPSYDVDGDIIIYISNDNTVTITYWGKMYYIGSAK